MDNSAELTAGALRSKPEESLESARELFFTRGYPDWQALINGRGRAAGVGADRLPDDRHPQRRPLRSGRRRRGRRDRRALREAADDHPGRGPAAARRPSPPNKTPFVVAYTYTGFPMVMLATRAGPRRRDRRGPQGRGVVSAGVAGDQARSRGAEAGLVASRSRARREPRAAAATSAPTPTSSSGSSPAGRPRGSAAGSRRSFPAAPSTTTSPSWPSSTTAASPPSPPRRSPSAPRTTTASASAARPARSNGRSPTTPSSSTTPAASRSGSIARGPSTAISPARSSPTCGSPRATPKGSTRRSATCTGRSNGRSAAGGARRSPRRSSTPGSSTVSPAWRSSRPPSPVRSRAVPGWTCPTWSELRAIQPPASVPPPGACPNWSSPTRPRPRPSATGPRGFGLSWDRSLYLPHFVHSRGRGVTVRRRPAQPGRWR